MATEYKLSFTANQIDQKLGKIDSLAEKTELPTKVSQLENDSGFITVDDIPESTSMETTLTIYYFLESGNGSWTLDTHDGITYYSKSSDPLLGITSDGGIVYFGFGDGVVFTDGYLDTSNAETGATISASGYCEGFSLTPSGARYGTIDYPQGTIHHLTPGKHYILYAAIGGTERGQAKTAHERLSDLESRVTYLESFVCLKKGTQILMGDGTEKNIEDIQYGDIIKGWDFENNCQVNVKAYGAIRTGIANDWKAYVFENGEILEIFQNHPIYSKTDNMMKSSKDMTRGEICMDSEGNDCALTVVWNFADSEFTERYMLLTENSTYFANHILSGHHARDRMKMYSLGIKSFNKNLTEDEIELFKATGEVYNNAPRARSNNREYLKEIAPHLGVIGRAARIMDQEQKKLSKLDYKTIKHQQGKLSDEDFEKCCAECEEARAMYKIEEKLRGESEAEIRKIQDKYNLRTLKNTRDCFHAAHKLDMEHVRKNGLN